MWKNKAVSQPWGDQLLVMGFWPALTLADPASVCDRSKSLTTHSLRSLLTLFSSSFKIAGGGRQRQSVSRGATDSTNQGGSGRPTREAFFYQNVGPQQCPLDLRPLGARAEPVTFLCRSENLCWLISVESGRLCGHLLGERMEFECGLVGVGFCARAFSSCGSQLLVHFCMPAFRIVCGHVGVMERWWLTVRQAFAQVVPHQGQAWQEDEAEPPSAQLDPPGE
jgi:hypothetical protein